MKALRVVKMTPRDELSTYDADTLRILKALLKVNPEVANAVRSVAESFAAGYGIPFLRMGRAARALAGDDRPGA